MLSKGLSMSAPDASPFDASFLRYACDAVPNMMFVKDLSYRIVYANQAFLEMYAPEVRDQVIGRTMIEHFPEVEAAVFLEEDRKAFVYGYSELIEELTNYKGEKLIWSTRKTRFTGTDGKTYIFGICLNITAQRKKEMDLAQSVSVLENFAAVAAHDLRSPLGTIISCLDIIRLDPDSKLSDKSLGYMGMVQNSVRGLMDQIGSLLRVYKVNKGGDTEFEKVDVKLLLDDVMFNLRNLIQETRTIIRTNMLPELNIDPNLFRQLFHNLIENSIKNRAVSKTPIIIIKYENRDGRHHFTIEDNGMGLQVAGPAMKPSAEYQKDNLRKLKTGSRLDLESFGIGMTLCKQIIQHHKGEIWVDEACTEGYRVCLSIPELVRYDA